MKRWKDKVGTFALVETDYFGGCGTQSATLVIDGKITEVASKDSPINEALRKIGVVCKNNLDEFDTIGLGYYRTENDILESDFLK